jgi:hypothetical protein
MKFQQQKIMLFLLGSDLIVQRASYILGNGGVAVAASLQVKQI